MKSIIVYTAIFDYYDKLIGQNSYPNSHFRCFSDSVDAKEPWQVCRVHTRSALWTAKRYKILAHETFPNTSVSLWIDGNVTVLSNPLKAARKFLDKNDLAVFRHPDRGCIYDEASECIRLHKGNSSKIRKQVKKYKAQGFSSQSGLQQCTIIFRRHTDKIAALEHRWWSHLQKHSSRDQISFPVVVRDLGLDIRIIPPSEFGKYFHWTGCHAK